MGIKYNISLHCMQQPCQIHCTQSALAVCPDVARVTYFTAFIIIQYWHMELCNSAKHMLYLHQLDHHQYLHLHQLLLLEFEKHLQLCCIRYKIKLHVQNCTYAQQKLTCSVTKIQVQYNTIHVHTHVPEFGKFIFRHINFIFYKCDSLKSTFIL